MATMYLVFESSGRSESVKIEKEYFSKYDNAVHVVFDNNYQYNARTRVITDYAGAFVDTGYLCKNYIQSKGVLREMNKEERQLKWNKVERVIGTVIAIIGTVVGALFLLGEAADDDKRWWLYPILGLVFILAGVSAFVYTHSRKTFWKAVEDCWIYFIGFWVGLFKIITHFFKRRVEFFKLVRKYHKDGYTYIEIIKYALEAYKASKVTEEN